MKTVLSEQETGTALKRKIIYMKTGQPVRLLLLTGSLKTQRAGS
jgi:hypothetical protein